MNLCFISGNLGDDPRNSMTANGQSVTRFSLASKKKYIDSNGETKEITNWHRIIAWNSLADDATLLSKGDYVEVKGAESTHSYEKDGEKKYITEIVAASITVPLGYFRNKQER